MPSITLRAQCHLLDSRDDNFELFRLRVIKNFFVTVGPLDADNNFTMQGGALSVLGAANHAGLMGLSIVYKLCEAK